MALPPDRKVTTGEAIGSEAVNVRVTTSFATASVVVGLLEAMLTELSVGMRGKVPEPSVYSTHCPLLLDRYPNPIIF